MTVTVVTLEHWVCPVYGERYTLHFEGRPIITVPTEQAARDAAERHGWRVVADAGDDGLVAS